MNRADGFEASYPTAPATEDTVMPEELKAILDSNNYSTKEAVARHDEDVEMLETGADNGLELINMRGLDYDAPEWETFIQQWEPEEMALLACTWNEELLEEIGENVGAEGSVNGMSGGYAPGLNTHRSPFGGRNFEYFSEDPFLAGKLAAREISGTAEYGVFTYIKHFAMNDQEAFCRSWCCGMHMDESLDRFQNDEWMLMTWATEQTVREIYLKAFEIAVKEAATDLRYIDSDGNEQVVEDFQCATGVMTGFNCVGNTWAGGNSALLQTVLRDEWGFRGTACQQSNRKNFVDQKDPSATTVKYLQEATHQMCYMVANSNAMNDIAPGAEIHYSLAPWEKSAELPEKQIGNL